MREIKITKAESNQRLDKYLMKYFNKASKSFIYKMIRKKNIKCNKKKVENSYILSEGDILQLYISDETIEKFSVNNLKILSKVTFRVVYEDANILICNKPIGLLSQKNSKEDNSLVEQVISYLIKSKQYDPNKTKGFKPGICNRLDRNTSGIIIIGKNIMALQSLNKLIKENNINKYYYCIVRGKVDKNIVLDDYIEKDKTNNKVKVIKKDNSDKNLKRIKTIIRPVKYNEKFSLLEIQLITGKTHQIRAHLQSINHPIIGDQKYGDQKINKQFKAKYGLKSQFLHAYKIVFNNTDSYLDYLKGKSFSAEKPEIMKKIQLDLF